MNNVIDEQIYQSVPTSQTERLRQFRLTHTFTSTTIGGLTWDYLACGKGDKTLLLLPGEERRSDLAFSLVQAWEQEYHIIYPSYPAVATIEPLVSGLVELLNREHVTSVYLLGRGFGGNVAQCFVRQYPHMVEKLVLQNTSVPQSDMITAVVALEKSVSFLSEKIVREIVKRMMLNLTSVPSREQSFWQSYASELANHQVTKQDILALLQGTIDYRRNYHFKPDDLQEWPGKLLIIESNNDRPITRSMRKALKAAYPQAQLYTFKHAGHTPFLMEAEEYLSIVNAFLHEAR